MFLAVCKDPLRSKTRDASSSMSVEDEGKDTVKNKEAELVSKDPAPKKNSDVLGPAAARSQRAEGLQGDVVYLGRCLSRFESEIWANLQAGRRCRGIAGNYELYITLDKMDPNIPKMQELDVICYVRQKDNKKEEHIIHPDTKWPLQK